MQTRTALTAETRTILGKRVKRLRAEGILPGNVYGRGFDSIPIQVPSREFVRSVRSAGVRSMFELTIDGESQPRLVLIRGLDRHLGMGDPIHVDFFQVDLERRLQTSVPIVLVGQSAAVTDLGGTLLHGVESLLVRCLPLDIPETIEVDVAILADFESSVSVGDLELPENVEVLLDASVMVATVNAPRLATEEELEEGEEGEEGAEVEEGAEGEEGTTEEAPSEGE
jgi:large subunit ribosomal protein L25